MRFPNLVALPMALALGLSGVAAAVTPAAAAPAKHLSDSEYLALARCAGLSKGLGDNPAAFDKALDDQAAGRESFVVDKATETREDTVRAVKHAGSDTKARMTAERDGVCQGYLSA